MKHAILMSDVVGSMRSDQVAVNDSLSLITSSANDTWAHQILSPLTVTLGDEFQGVAKSYHDAMQICFWVDEASRRVEPPLRLRFSIVYGDISTPINETVAHGMIGEGLQHARELISKKSRRKVKYQAKSGIAAVDSMLSDLLSVMESISLNWRQKDFELIDSMLQNTNDNEVGLAFGKLRQQIYKRRDTLMIADYQALKRVILKIASTVGHTS